MQTSFIHVADMAMEKDGPGQLALLLLNHNKQTLGTFLCELLRCCYRRLGETTRQETHQFITTRFCPDLLQATENENKVHAERMGGDQGDANF